MKDPKEEDAAGGDSDSDPKAKRTKFDSPPSLGDSCEFPSQDEPDVMNQKGKDIKMIEVAKEHPIGCKSESPSEDEDYEAFLSEDKSEGPTKRSCVGFPIEVYDHDREDVDESKNEKVYVVWLENTEKFVISHCVNLLQQIDHESGFIRCSKKLPHVFYVHMNDDQAARLSGVKGVSKVWPLAEIYNDC